MCGIAGYNVSEKWAKANLTQPKTESMLQEAWFHNVHRGWDAAGYFSVNLEDEVQIFKEPGVAPQIFHSSIFEADMLMTSKVLAAHTRAPSSGAGDPSINENNHPVGYGGVWTTHNGTLWNDEEIKEEIAGKEKYKELPIVDSLAISMQLSLESPKDFDSILEALGEIRGAFSIHSMWQTFPGVSLLARSSANNPLVMAVNTEDQGIFYGSEKESIWGMLTEAGQNPNNAELWEWRSLDPGFAILIEDGRVINWGTFEDKVAGWAQASKLKYTMHRWLPKEGKRKRTQVYETDHEFDYVNKARRPSFYNTILGTVLYTREGGFTEDAKDEGFPYAKGELEWGAVLAEADEIRKDGDLIHVFFGAIELIVTSNGRIIRDVFNHDLFTKNQRWTKIKKKKDRPLVKIRDDWSDFWRLRTTGIHIVPDKPTEYAYIAELELEHTKKMKQIGYGKRSGVDLDEPKSLVGLKEMAPIVTLQWGNVYDQLVVHETHPTLKFLTDGVCPEHTGEAFTSHSKAFKCKRMLYAASFTMAAFAELDIHRVWMKANGKNGEGMIVYQMPDQGDMCEADGEKNCYWTVTEEVAFINEDDELYWKTITQEECIICGTIRYLDKLPAWTQLIDTVTIEGKVYAS
ncbi:hypothetical protein LCGC14_1382090 [marine sediment metagenome]|uniref:Glutamine amidotransferase type-2 domain-containing protein n=1 Tax=marine sediment metagenome TaxID=412755 RepID=A0A0F9MHT8_9ZZZZ